MQFKNEQEVIDKIKANLTLSKWVITARDNHRTLKALVLGKDFSDVLINKIEKIESEDRKVARKKYSKDIRDMFDRVMQPRTNVFSASGGSTTNELTGVVKDKLIKILDNFKGQKSIKQYLSDNLFRLEDTDPNGLLFMEYKADEKIYPTYKSINDIRIYESNGQLLEYVIFEPKKTIVEGVVIIEWRVVDSRKDYTFKQIGGNTLVLDEDKTFEHPFGSVPAVILSDIQEMGSELRISPLFPIEELAKEYARDKSILTIYKFQNGMPRHWRYERFCRRCQGSGKSNDKTVCDECKGTGTGRRNDVTDITVLDLPREGQPIVTPNLEGFVSPDLATWKQYKEDLQGLEDLTESTMWGTRRVQRGANETATGRFIDVQPVTNKISKFADNYEWICNQLIGYCEDWINGKPKDKKDFTYIAGRRFIIESPDILLDKYTESMTKGVNSSVLDKLLEEFIYSKYQTNSQMLETMLKKKNIEPYVHLTTPQVNEIFGREEAYKKSLFVDFWEQADTSKDEKVLKTDFKAFIDANKITPIEVIN